MNDMEPRDFIRKIIYDDLESGKHDEIVTRFPPEPNGYLHIGHVMAICLDFGVAEETGGRTFLRLDDTNPGKESPEYVQAIKDDVHWLGFDWGDRLTHASDYFDQLYEAAEKLIEMGLAYVDSLSAEEIRAHRGTLTEPGTNSPYRERSVEENLDLFRRMRAGEFADGEHVLRAKIDMASPNMNLRDPALYRIRHIDHQRTGNTWCIYPMYDWAHGQSDSIEGITHSLCSLEYEIHRPLYDWFIEQLGIYAPRQMEFSRLNLAYTIMSKRKLVQLVNNGHVHGWDDPRMPTLAGMRRRGYTPGAIRNFISLVGVSKVNSVIDPLVLEQAVRNDLNEHTTRVMAVLDPLRVVIDNYPEGQEEYLAVPDYPQDRSRTETRQVPFSKVIYIEREYFMEEPPSNFFRWAPGREVRLMKAY